MNILLFLLGCNIRSILLNRIEVSFKFIESINNHTQSSNNNIFNGDTNTNVFLKKFNNVFNIDEFIENNNGFGDGFNNGFNDRFNDKINITWFLSGGSKNFDLSNDIENNKKIISEAHVMKSIIDEMIGKKIYNIDWNFILDEKSSNTAENFIHGTYFLNTTSTVFDSIYVVSSNYHYERAHKILKLIDASRNYNWILGNLEEINSRYLESLHMKNINSDVDKAFKKINKI